MGQRENAVELYLRSEIEKLGGITRKWVSPGAPGVPDQIIILHGRSIYAEVKTTDGTTSAQQDREHARLLHCGAEVITLHGHAEVDVLIKGLARWKDHQESSST